MPYLPFLLHTTPHTFTCNMVWFFYTYPAAYHHHTHPHHHHCSLCTIMPATTTVCLPYTTWTPLLPGSCWLDSSAFSSVYYCGLVYWTACSILHTFLVCFLYCLLNTPILQTHPSHTTFSTLPSTTTATYNPHLLPTILPPPVLLSFFYPPTCHGLYYYLPTIPHYATHLPPIYSLPFLTYHLPTILLCLPLLPFYLLLQCIFFLCMHACAYALRGLRTFWRMCMAALS